MKIWKCRNCDVGRRLPDRLDDDDMRKVCVPCSQTTGRIVRLYIPSIESAKAERAARRKARAALVAERENTRAFIAARTWPGVRGALFARWARKADAWVWSDNKKVRVGPERIGNLSAETICGVIRSDVSRIYSMARADKVALSVDARAEHRTKLLAKALGVKPRALVGQGDLGVISWSDVYRIIDASYVGWLVELTGVQDADAKTAIGYAIETCNVHNIDTIETLNTLIKNALVLQGAVPETFA